MRWKFVAVAATAAAIVASAISPAGAVTDLSVATLGSCKPTVQLGPYLAIVTANPKCRRPIDLTITVVTNPRTVIPRPTPWYTLSPQTEVRVMPGSAVMTGIPSEQACTIESPTGASVILATVTPTPVYPMTGFQLTTAISNRTVVAAQTFYRGSLDSTLSSLPGTKTKVGPPPPPPMRCG